MPEPCGPGGEDSLLTEEWVGVLLAAGAGRRFGGGKLLARLADGTPLALAASRALSAGVDRALAVVAPGDGALAALLEAAGLAVVINPDPARGMGSSLAAGVAAAPGAAGWVIALGDMPWVPAQVVAQVTEALRAGALIAAPECDGCRGHPVGFAATLGPELLRISGDRGGRELAERYGLQVVPTRDRGVLRDVDRPEDLTGTRDSGRRTSATDEHG